MDMPSARCGRFDRSNIEFERWITPCGTRIGLRDSYGFPPLADVARELEQAPIRRDLEHMGRALR